MDVEMEVKQTIDITEEEFMKYEKLRVMGIVNMFDRHDVKRWIGLSMEKIMAIHKAYEELKNKFDKDNKKAKIISKRYEKFMENTI